MSDDFLLKIAQKTVGKLGNDFLLALVENLRNAMDASLVFVAEGIGEPPARAHMRCSMRNGEEVEPVTYDLEGTPCKVIYDGQSELFYVPDGLWQKFPKEVGFESYCGAPLYNIENRISGHLAVISETPIQNLSMASNVVRVFALRAQAELRRIEYDAKLEQSIARLERQRDMLNKANSFKSDLLAMIAHDMRNPLQAIVSSGELIKTYNSASSAGGGEIYSKIDKSCDVITRTTERMEKMIALMMKNGRANATSFKAHCADVPLLSPVQTALGLRAGAANLKNIELSEMIDPGLHAWVDEDLLIEALDNLVGNAIKFSPKGKRVVIKSQVSDGFAELRIIDEGQGMERDEFDHAFKPFQTVSSRPTGSETSTGLGLAIVRSIAEAHGGAVDVASDGKDKGCAFTLSLPLEA